MLRLLVYVVGHSHAAGVIPAGEKIGRLLHDDFFFVLLCVSMRSDASVFSADVMLFLLVALAVILTAVVGYAIIYLYDKHIRVLRLKRNPAPPPTNRVTSGPPGIVLRV